MMVGQGIAAASLWARAATETAKHSGNDSGHPRVDLWWQPSGLCRGQCGDKYHRHPKKFLEDVKPQGKADAAKNFEGSVAATHVFEKAVRGRVLCWA